MIPFNPQVFLILAILNLIKIAAFFLIIYVALFALRVYFIARKEQVPFIRLLFKSKFFIVVLIITLIFSGISWITIADEVAFKSDYTTRQKQIDSRRNFVLEQDHLYGEFIFPKGTLINRYDPSDNGEETYPLILSGLRTAQFPEPTEIAGILATKIDAGGFIELAEDQEVGPVHFYASKFGRHGGWMVDRTTPVFFCPKGSVALFEKPLGPGIDLDDEFWWKDKDGEKAYFRPSEWQFRYCNNRRTIDVLPAFGSEEAIQLERAEAVKRAEKANTPQTIIKDGVLMDAEPIEFTISFYLEAMSQYLFTAQKSGLEADYLAAYKLFEQAAENGEEEAYYDLGMMNYYGEGVPKNREAALDWFNKSANAGNAKAVAMIGTIYFEDDSIKDYDHVLSIFTKAAAEGDLTAEFYLGRMYVQGLGVEQNYATGLAWFKKAAHPLHAAGMTGYHHLSINAMLNVGRIYAEGLLGEEDPKAAEPWYEKACYLDSQKACELWEEIKLKI